MPPAINFPASLDTAKTLYNPFNRYKWTSFLKSTITASATDVILTDSVDIPAQVAGNYIGIDDEIMFVSSINNTDPSNRKLVVVRGQGDSDATTHDAAVEVVQCHTAELHNKHNEAIIALETYVLAAVPVALTIPITATPFTYAMASTAGYKYRLTVSVESSDNSRATIKSYTIIHWNIAGRTPQSIEGELITHGAEIDVQIANLLADMISFNIVVTDANGGSMKVSVSEKVAI